MKKINIFKILTAIILFAASPAIAQQKKVEKAVIKTTIYCDHCSACETCGKNLNSELLKVKGVKMYELDEKKMTITVFYNSRQTDVPTIRTAISKLGYDADEIKADIAGYEKLDGCCKKA